MLDDEYEVEFTRAAARQFWRLSRETANRIAPKIDALATDPRPAGCSKLSGFNSAFRIRVGSYRVIYVVDDDAMVVTVTRVGARGQIYRT